MTGARLTVDQTRTALRILWVAVPLGAVGDALLHTTPWGLNCGLWVVALATGTLVVAPGTRRRCVPWLIAAVAFAAFMTWRASAFLNFWNLLAAITCLTLVAIRSYDVSLADTTPFRYLTGAADTALSAAVGSPLLIFGDVTWDRASQNPLERSRSVLVGLLLATPLVLVFGTLLKAADPVFENVVASLFDWDFASISSHVIIGCAIAWLTAGYLRHLVFTRPTFSSSLPDPRSPGLGMVEIGIPLGMTTLIFMVFVIIQIRYLFGGEQLVQESLGLSYSEYARRGFFEIVTAAALIIPVVVTADWMLDTSSRRNRQSFTALAILLLLLVTAVMMSALKRMQLYVHAYGLTEDRVYATAFMLWIAFVLGWLAVTVLRRRRHRFAYGTIIGGLTVMVILNVLNPAAIIAHTNLSRAESGQELDVLHLARLGADAAPTISSRLPELSDGDKCAVVTVMAAQQWAIQRGDWRSWNVGRQSARRVIRDLEHVMQSCEHSRASEEPASGR